VRPDAALRCDGAQQRTPGIGGHVDVVRGMEQIRWAMASSMVRAAAACGTQCAVRSPCEALHVATGAVADPVQESFAP